MTDISNQTHEGRNLVDWAVFTIGAISLAVALGMTLTGVLVADPANAQTAQVQVTAE